MAYHADMSKADKQATYSAFMMNTCDVVVATVAFGMGIDKPDVRFVLHLDVPTSVENYVQETGRAGRDGKDSECVLYFSKTDCARKTFALTSDSERASFAKMVKFAETTTCRRAYLHAHFEQPMPPGACTKCDNCHTVVWDTENQTANARHILQCITDFRTRQFGANYIVDVLRGAQLSKIKANQHTTIGSFGQCRTQPKALLLDVLSRLLERGYLVQTPGKYTVCVLTPSGRDFLTGTEPFLIKKRQTSGMVHNHELRARLLHYRTQRALLHQVAPHSILSEPTIDALVSTPIHTTADLQKITGMSETKWTMFGAELLQLIRTNDTTAGPTPHDACAHAPVDAPEPVDVHASVEAGATTTHPLEATPPPPTHHSHADAANPPSPRPSPPHAAEATMAIHAKQLQTLVDDGRLTTSQAVACVDQYARDFPNLVVSSLALDDVAKRRVLCQLFCEYGTLHIDTIATMTRDTCTQLELRMFGIWWTHWNTTSHAMSDSTTASS